MARFVVMDSAGRLESAGGAAGRPVLTAPATVRTPKWGDLVGRLPQGGYGPPDGVVGANDIVALIDAFKGMPGPPPLYAADL